LVAAIRLEEGGVTIIVAAAQDEAAALDVPLHDFKELADFIIGLLFAVADVSEGEKGLGAAETAAKLGQGSIVGDCKDARGIEGLGQPLDAKNHVYENGVDVGEGRILVKVGLKLLMQFMGGLSAAVLALGDKVLPEDGTIAVDDDKSKRRGFLAVLLQMTRVRCADWGPGRLIDW
jgi:hypothetical protein